MHPAPSLFLSLLAATLSVAQLSPDINYCEGDKSTLGHCDTLTYEDTTLSAANPPTTTECQESCFSIFGDAGEWIVQLEGKPEGYQQHMHQFPCGFSIGAIPNTPHEFSFDMNNQDMADIIDEAVKRFAHLHGGKVAARGTVRCDGHEAMCHSIESNPQKPTTNAIAAGPPRLDPPDMAAF
ncbi:uncharacterized protein J4E79_009480 [Alternaria viburni]|uniref:uncharacterized protein n=1 Tax=Alternaria viburni TaxID=566460 RepID=UPI0020C20F60|nr:uncharacterized protein J4E79_009480 [Alternaria viburni]KAI4650213.1 hypothetical protein J4E79_009480 [Alternaria viburni]